MSKKFKQVQIKKVRMNQNLLIGVISMTKNNTKAVSVVMMMKARIILERTNMVTIETIIAIETDSQKVTIMMVVNKEMIGAKEIEIIFSKIKLIRTRILESTTSMTINSMKQ